MTVQPQETIISPNCETLRLLLTISFEMVLCSSWISRKISKTNIRLLHLYLRAHACLSFPWVVLFSLTLEKIFFDRIKTDTQSKNSKWHFKNILFKDNTVILRNAIFKIISQKSVIFEQCLQLRMIVGAFVPWAVDFSTISFIRQSTIFSLEFTIQALTSGSRWAWKSRAVCLVALIRQSDKHQARIGV